MRYSSISLATLFYFVYLEPLYFLGAQESTFQAPHLDLVELLGAGVLLLWRTSHSQHHALTWLLLTLQTCVQGATMWRAADPTLQHLLCTLRTTDLDLSTHFYPPETAITTAGVRFKANMTLSAMTQSDSDCCFFYLRQCDRF